MALIQRVSRLFRADMHAVLDRLEEPDVLLKQSIREMEQSLEEQQHRLKRGAAELQQLQARRAEIEQSLAALEQELDLCFNAGKEDLARSLIKRKLETQHLQKFVTRKHDVTQSQWQALQTAFHENQKRLESMKQKAEVLCAGADCAPSPDRTAASDYTVGPEQVEVAFLREKQARTRS